MQEKIKAGIITITPTEKELKEGSYWDRARNQLMRETEKAEVLKYLEKTAAELNMRVVDEKLAEEATSLPTVESRLRQERKKTRKLTEDVKALVRESSELKERLARAPIVGPGEPHAVPAPIREPPRRGEMVVSRDCYPLFDRLWKTIQRQATMEHGTRVVSNRTGIGARLIGRSLMAAKGRNLLRQENLIDQILACECIGETS